MTTIKRSFILYENWAILLRNLSDEKAGVLIKAICAYQLGEEDLKIEDETLSAIFQSWIPKIAEDTRAYDEVCEKRRAAANKKHEKQNGSSKVSAKKSRQMHANAEKSTNLQSNASKSMQMHANADKCMQVDASVSKSSDLHYDTDTDTDTNINANALISARAREEISDQDVIDEYNKVCSALPKAELNEARHMVIHERLQFQGWEFLCKAFKIVSESDFLCNSKFCNFDWIMRMGNLIKIMDGLYDNKRASPSSKFINFDSSNVDYDAIAARKHEERMRGNG